MSKVYFSCVITLQYINRCRIYPGLVDERVKVNNNIVTAPVNTGNDKINKITVTEIDHESKLI